MNQNDIEYITIGKIINTQGHMGMLRVLPLTDFPERFSDMEVVELLQDNVRNTYNIEKVQRHKGYVLIKFKEIQDMNAALKLKGALLQVTKDRLVKLPGDSYYIFDIIGLEVRDMDGVNLGTVKDIIQTGANDVYVVESGETKRSILIPALKSVIKRIDTLEKIMMVELPEGLEDI